MFAGQHGLMRRISEVPIPANTFTTETLPRRQVNKPLSICPKRTAVRFPKPVWHNTEGIRHSIGVAWDNGTAAASVKPSGRPPDIPTAIEKHKEFPAVLMEGNSFFVFGKRLDGEKIPENGNAAKDFLYSAGIPWD